ncbi:hypothetical protein [Stenotrophomonas lactitubi]|uniref:hypothetical protein n=1 Tax=Stenotrophomonas lactitubi TaxID=2045214 RepID=UPI003207AFA6
MRKPLIIGPDNQVAELSIGDRVFSAGSVPMRLRAEQTFHVPIDDQALYSQPIVLDAGAALLLDGMLVEVR